MSRNIKDELEEQLVKLCQTRKTRSCDGGKLASCCRIGSEAGWKNMKEDFFCVPVQTHEMHHASKKNRMHEEPACVLRVAESDEENLRLAS